MAFKRDVIIRTAEKYVSKGKIEAAIREYRKVLRHSPSDVNTLNRVGDLYARLESFDEAVRLFTQIAEQYTREGFFVKAIAIYKKIIKLNPSSLQVYEKLAALYAEQGLVTEARTQYKVLADYYQKHENAASAITIYQRMAELEPENPAFHLKLAELFASRQLVDRALTSYARLADIFLVGGSVDEAAKVYLTALDVSSDDLTFIERAVRSLAGAGSVSAATRVLAEATARNPAVAGLSSRVGLSEAERDVERAFEPLPPAGDGDGGWSRAALDDAELEQTNAAAAGVDPSPKFEAQPFRLDLDELDELADSGLLGDPPVAAAPGANAVAQHPPGVDLELEPESSPDSDLFVFDLDLDDDGVPESQVQPPEDMIDASSAAWAGEAAPTAERERGEQGDQDQTPASPASIAGGDDALAPGALEVDLGETLDSAEIAALEDADLDNLSFDVTVPETEAGEKVSDPAEPAEVPIEIDWSLGPLEAAAGEGQDQAPPMPESPAPPVETVSEDSPSRSVRVRLAAVRREEDLIAEAQVFAKYGLRGKAEARLRDMWNLNPDNLEAMRLKIDLLLEDGDPEAVIVEANAFAELAERTAAPALWHGLRDRLLEVGYQVADDRLMASPDASAEPTKHERISQFLEVLEAGSAKPDETLAEAASGGSGSDEALVGQIDDALDTLFGVARSPSAGSSGTQVDPLAPSALTDAPAPDTGAAPGAGSLFDETGLSWLEGAESAADPATEEAGKDDLFDEDDEFFDLAAEIERELDEEDALAPAPLAAPSEPSLEQIVEGFKRGVSEHLSTEDYDTHFNLGIAYREMGLLDEAISEFQLSSKDARYLVESSAMLGVSFLEKGLPDLALKWYRKGLEAPGIDEKAMLGLLYDMAGVYEQIGNLEAAHTTWVEIYGTDSSYRDVSKRLERSTSLSEGG